MSSEYRNNHFVPEWYQKRFMLADQTAKNLHYLDLKPEQWTDPRGQVHTKRAVNWWGASKCFAAKDLYRTTYGSQDPAALEKVFFGGVDSIGRKAVEYFTQFQHPSAEGGALFNGMMAYMTVQKLRTPKGLGWLTEKAGRDRDRTLQLVVRLQNLYSALWCECVWALVDATNSPTKFIVSDHPVTVYNRRCGPRSQWCRGFGDPDIAFHGSHTIFPLSLERALVLTNLSWVRNPYQSEVGVRPNPNPWRSSIFNFTAIQTGRSLTEQEVQQINFIIKQRAYRHVAAAREEWLYPEQHVSRSHWGAYGDGYLLMPDPRPVHLGGEMIIGYRGGGSDHFDAYGRRPWQKDYGKETAAERRNLYRFQGEFARRYGPKRRGLTWEETDRGLVEDSDSLHNYFLSLDK